MEKFIVKSAGHELFNYLPISDNTDLGTNQKKFYLEIVKSDINQKDLLQDMVLMAKEDEDVSIVISNIVAIYPLEGRSIYEVWILNEDKKGVPNYYFLENKEWTIQYTLMESTLTKKYKHTEMENKVQEGNICENCKYWVLTGSGGQHCDKGFSIDYDSTCKLFTDKDVLDTQIGGEHYKGKIQPVEFILANNIGFCEGNIIKYIYRYKNKNGLQDLEKAKHYLDILIENYKKDTAC